MTDPAVPILDLAVLEELRAATGNDQAFVADLIETYLADGEGQIAAIEAAAAARDPGAAIRPAHTLKTGSATIGATRLAALCRALEADARGGVPPTDDRAGTARSEWSLADSALRAWLAAAPDR